MSSARPIPFPCLHEPAFEYKPFPREKGVYEIALTPLPAVEGLKTLPGVHRLVQTLLQGQLAGQYEILDFLIWPEGLFIRASLRKARTLSSFIQILKEKSTPPGVDIRTYWNEELTWIRLIPPEKIRASTQSFLETVDHIRREIYGTAGLTNHLFFFYRNPRITE